MQRFNRLELENAQATTSETSTTTPLRDEKHWLAAARAERESGLYENALRLYSRALEADRSLVAGWVGQVQMLIALGEYKEADLWSRKALELFKNNAELLAGRAQALCRLGDQKTALASSDLSIAQQGHFAYSWLARGEVMLARSERTDAYCFDKAIQIENDWLLRLEIGDIYCFHHRPAKGLAYYRQAVEQAPDQPHAWFRQGICENELGLTGPSCRSLARCLELSPKHERARMTLHRISTESRPVRQWFKRLLRWR